MFLNSPVTPSVVTGAAVAASVKNVETICKVNQTNCRRCFGKLLQVKLSVTTLSAEHFIRYSGTQFLVHVCKYNQNFGVFSYPAFTCFL